MLISKLPYISFLSLFGVMFFLVSCQSRTGNKEPEKKIKIACVGNSITFGLGIKNRQENAYPPQLNKLLGADYEVKNFGVSGCTILKQGDMPYWDEPTYQESLDYNPDIVIIKLGTNDSKLHNWEHSNDFVADYEEIITVFKNLPTRPKVYICFPVPLYFTGNNINDSTIVKHVIPKIDSIKNNLSIPVIDLYHPLLNHPEYFPDGIHPNADGAEIIAKTVAKFIVPD